jgi:hypothetical protein
MINEKVTMKVSKLRDLMTLYFKNVSATLLDQTKKLTESENVLDQFLDNY